MSDWKLHARLRYRSSLWSDSPKPAGAWNQGCFGRWTTSLLGTTGTPEMKQWLRNLRDAGIRIIVVSNNIKNASTSDSRNLGLTFVGLKPFIGLTMPWRNFIMRKVMVMVGDQLAADIRAAHPLIRSILVDMVNMTRLNTGVARGLDAKITEMWTVYKKNLTMKILCIGCEQPFRRQIRLVLVLPQCARKGWRLVSLL